MSRASFAVRLGFIAATALASLGVPACSQTPVVVPLRSMERPKDVDYICLKQVSISHWEGASLEDCAAAPDGSRSLSAPADANYHLHAVVTQESRGELAVADIGVSPQDTGNVALIKVDPRIPGYSFIPVGAVPTDVAADPMGKAVYVASGRDARVDIIPSNLLRGPIDTSAEQGDQPPWPHLDFDRATEGVPTALAIVREGDKRRLYVVLGEALPQPKLAVFDLSDAPLAPAKVGDITLSLGAASPLPWAPLDCGSAHNPAPWWAAYDKNCFGLDLSKTTAGTNVAGPPTDMHLAGVAVSGTLLYAADDRAPVVHVFDVGQGKGVEIRRIPVGSPTSRVAISPPVPDEVTVANVPGIDVCQERGWFGDGLDHSGESPTIKATLGAAHGQCRLHRYLYAIDLFDPAQGNGSLAIVDLPILYANSANRTGESIAWDPVLDATGAVTRPGATLVQAMGCDSPTLPARRLLLGPFGVSGINQVPVRAVAFLTNDPPPPNVAYVPAARCRAWDDGSYPYRTKDDKPIGELTPADGIAPAARDARLAAGIDWRGNVGAQRLRGTFAYVALANGALDIVDIDDFDATCRGPALATDTQPGKVSYFRYPGDPEPVAIGTHATGEFYPRVVQRHHPRSNRLLTGDVVPVASTPTLSRFTTQLTNDPTTETGPTRPSLAPLAFTEDGQALFVLPAGDNPYAVTTETFTLTYEGPLPGYTGSFGALTKDATGQLTFTDPSGSFCGRGVEDDHGAPEANDTVQIVAPLCGDDAGTGCDASTLTMCQDRYGLSTDTPLKPSRTLYIQKAFDDQLVIAPKHWDLQIDPKSGAQTFVLVDGDDLDNLQKCFRTDVHAPSALPLLRYTVRATGAWVVTGSISGYATRRTVDPKADPMAPHKACVTDENRSHVFDGRVRTELPPLPANEQTSSWTSAGLVPPDNNCHVYRSSSWMFAIRAGTSPSLQDMQLTFGVRWAWTPLSLGAGQLPQTVKPVTAFWDGVEHLNWDMIGVVDAIDRGLFVVPALNPFDTTYQKVIQ